MALNDIYESTSRFLKAADLAGQKPVVTIETAEVVENDFGDDGKKKQIVLSFVGKDKVLGLNFTNAARISELLGTEEYEDWVGHSIKLFTEMTKFQGKMVPAIRIFPELPEAPTKAKAATAKRTQTEPDHEEDPNFDPTQLEPVDDVSIPF